jgi:hypothetical protein
MVLKIRSEIILLMTRKQPNSNRETNSMPILLPFIFVGIDGYYPLVVDIIPQMEK